MENNEVGLYMHLLHKPNWKTMQLNPVHRYSEQDAVGGQESLASQFKYHSPTRVPPDPRSCSSNALKEKAPSEVNI